MFLHVSVILFTGGGVCPLHAGITPPARTRGKHPPGPGYPPQTRHTPWEQIPLSAVHAWRYGQQAGGMHPTGMQSCHIERLRSCLRSCKEQVVLFPVKPVTCGVDAK